MLSTIDQIPGTIFGIDSIIDCSFTVPNKPPVANAGGDKTITLPQRLVTIDGSKSSDDKGIVRYSWARDHLSQAAGVSVVITRDYRWLQVITWQGYCPIQLG